MPEEKFLTRIQKLLDKANDPAVAAFPEEREALLAKADDLMIKHGIEEAMLMAAMSKDARKKPITERFHAADPYAPHWEKFRTVLSYLAKLQRVRTAFYDNGDVMLVGFYEDVEYLKMKWLNVYLHFSKTIDPSWDKSLTPEGNVYAFKVAGYQWGDIQLAAAMNGIDKPFHWFKPAYQRYCRVIGEQPTRHTQRNFAYRETFAEAFRARICERVLDLIRDRDGQTSEAGALVAVRDLTGEIDEMFWTLFPHLRPETAEQKAARAARLEALEEALRKQLEAMTPAQRREYDKEQERIARQAAKDNADYWKNERTKYDSAGHASGTASADKVDLSRSAAAEAGRKAGELS